jgi:betaine-homocysteine S-methyltransferase
VGRQGGIWSEAFTYYAHRQKLKVIGREGILEEMNRQALRIARDVAVRHGCLMAGDICNTNAYEAEDKRTHAAVRAMFEEQIGWAVEEKADFLIAETIDWCGEAEIALGVMKRSGLPAVVTLSVHRDESMFDGVPVVDALKRLEDAGADVVGLNCQRGPRTLMPIVRRVREAVSCHVAALPVPYRTTEAEPTFQTSLGRSNPSTAPSTTSSRRPLGRSATRSFWSSRSESSTAWSPGIARKP